VFFGPTVHCAGRARVDPEATRRPNRGTAIASQSVGCRVMIVGYTLLAERIAIVS